MKPRYLFLLLMITLATSLFYLSKDINNKSTNHSNDKNYIDNEKYVTYNADFYAKSISSLPKAVLERAKWKDFFNTYHIKDDFSNLKLIVRLSKKKTRDTRDVKMIFIYGDNEKEIKIWPNSYIGIVDKLKNGHEIVHGQISGEFKDTIMKTPNVFVQFIELPQDKQVSFNVLLVDSNNNEIMLPFGNLQYTEEIIKISSTE